MRPLSRPAVRLWAALLLGCLGAGRAGAQDAPDPSLKPNYGSVDLKAGYLPDPYTKDLTAGGNLQTKLGGVATHVTASPDFRLNYTAGSYPLTLHVKSAGDTTLLVNLPDGKWIANDDFGGQLNPLLRFEKPQSGQYDIWVGTFNKQPVPAKLLITELPVDTKVVVAPTPTPTPVKGVRPFFVMGHHANNVAVFNDHVANGATVIEHDIHMYTPTLTFSGSDKIYVMHFLKDEFTRKFTNSDGVDAYYRNVKSHMDAGRVVGVVCDVKTTLVSDGPIHYSANSANPRHYGRVLANTLKRNGIPASRVVMGIDQPDSWASEFMKGVRWDAQYDALVNLYVPYSKDTFKVTSQAVIDQWANTIVAGSDVGELGMDESVRGAFSTPWPNWSRWLTPLVNRRLARSGDLRFVYYWTINNETDMRNALDVGVDGILTDHPAKLKAIAGEPKYKDKFRLANKDDFMVAASDRVKRSLDDPFVYLTLRHQGGYVAKFYVSWTVNGAPQSRDFGSKTLGWSDTLAIPRNAANLRVHAQAAVFIATWRDIHNGGVSAGSFVSPASYTAGGTTLNRTWR